jgi:hypothetical protein
MRRPFSFADTIVSAFAYRTLVKLGKRTFFFILLSKWGRAGGRWVLTVRLAVPKVDASLCIVWRHFAKLVPEP